MASPRKGSAQLPVDIVTCDDVHLYGFYFRPNPFGGGGMQVAPVGSDAVLLTHPHSKLGGDLHNNVVVWLQRSFARAGIATLRLNFRGVEPSKGSASWRGTDERNDVSAAIDYLVSRGHARVWVVGYSFGAAVAALPAVRHPSVVGYCAIAYPLGYMASIILGHHWRAFCAHVKSKPCCFVMGELDQFCGVGTLESSVGKVKGLRAEVHIVEGDHFLMGVEDALLPAVEWVLRGIHALNTPRMSKMPIDAETGTGVAGMVGGMPQQQQHQHPASPSCGQCPHPSQYGQQSRESEQLGGDSIVSINVENNTVVNCRLVPRRYGSRTPVLVHPEACQNEGDLAV